MYPIHIAESYRSNRSPSLVSQLYNTGGYHCDETGEDGYAAFPGVRDCAPHSSDYQQQDWVISLSELLRLIQFYNSGGYRACPGEGTEDGFCPDGDAAAEGE